MNYNFNPALPKPFNMIHPLQIKKVQAFLENPIPSQIEYILLFGGSVSLACHPGSDIDLFIIHEDTDEDTLDSIHQKLREYGKALNARFDFLYHTLDDFKLYMNDIGSVEYDANKEGICVYAKGKNNVTDEGEVGFTKR